MGGISSELDPKENTIDLKTEQLFKISHKEKKKNLKKKKKVKMGRVPEAQRKYLMGGLQGA